MSERAFVSAGYRPSIFAVQTIELQALQVLDVYLVVMSFRFLRSV